MTHTLSDVVEHLSSLPPFPKVTAKLLSLLNDPTASIEELSNVVSTDPSLALKVIHLANSPFYMLSKPIDSVKQAVFVLGMNTIKSITTAAAFQKGLDVYAPRTSSFNLQDFWKHSYATAIAARNLARIKCDSEQNRLYLAGLIHDIGKLIIAYHWPESWKRMVNHLRNGTAHYDEIEHELFMGSHAEIAAALGRNWQFPEDIVTLIEHHHVESITLGNHSIEQKVLCTADAIASSSGFPFPVEEAQKVAIMDLSEYGAIMETLESEVQYQLSSLDR